MAILLACAMPLIAADDAVFIGETGVLRGMKETALTIPVAIDANALDDFYKAIVAGDREGVEELIDQGRLFIVDVGTKVRVLSVTGLIKATMEIRVLEGVHKGRRGFVSSNVVVKD